MVSGCQWRLPRARLRLLPSRIRPGLGALAENSHCRGRAPAQRPGGPTHGADCHGHGGKPRRAGARARPARSESAWQRRSRRRSEPAQSNSEPESESPTVAARAGPVARARHCAGCGRINLASPVLEGGPAAAALPGAPGSGLRTHCSSVREPRRRR
jgi:hypothetical protein